MKSSRDIRGSEPRKRGRNDRNGNANFINQESIGSSVREAAAAELEVGEKLISKPLVVASSSVTT